jgi:hypothetical protein
MTEQPQQPSDGDSDATKDGICQLLKNTPKDRRSKMKVEKKVMETTHNTTTKYCFPCEE